jgi:LCP family protein required for cell wall assembly
VHRLRNIAIVVGTAVAVLATAAVGSWWWANRQFERIDTFDELEAVDPDGTARTATVPTALRAPDATGITTIAIISTGSSGVDASQADRLRIDRQRLGMADGLTDSIALVTIDADHDLIHITSIPRDLWSDTHRSRINAIYNDSGVVALLDELRTVAGIDIHHVVAVNFMAFADTVDALGGITATTATPVRDTHSGLALDGTCNTLDGAAALAWARSRHLEQRVDGRWRTDPTGDLGRTERQAQLATVIAANHGWSSFAATLPALFDVAADNVTRDPGLTLERVLELARSVRSGATITQLTPDVANERRGAAAVVTLTDTGRTELAAVAAAVRSGSLAAPGATAPGGTAPTAATPTAPAPSAPADTAPTPPDAGPVSRWSAVTLTACTP